MKSRAHFSHLPTANILDKILKTEEARLVPKSKQNLNFPKFDLLKKWLNSIKISTGFLDGKNDWKKMIDIGRKIQPEVVKKTLNLVSKSDPVIPEILKQIEKYLGKEDKPEKTDLIFVFGSKDLGRIGKAVKLWKKGFAKRILITGGNRFDTKEKQEPEALRFKKEALRLGVPGKNILIETSSITIADNIRSGLNLLDREKIEYKKIITIVVWFAQRRTWSHLMKYTLNTKIVRVNSDIKSGLLRQDNWHKNKVGLNIVFSEFLKMKMGAMLNTA